MKLKILLARVPLVELEISFLDEQMIGLVPSTELEQSLRDVKLNKFN